MTTRSLTATALRLVGIYLLARAVLSVPGVVVNATLMGSVVADIEAQKSFPSEVVWGWWHSVLFLVLAFLAGYAVLAGAERIAGWLVRDEEPVDFPRGQDTTRPLFYLAVKVIGAVIVVRVIPSLVQALIAVFSVVAGDSSSGNLFVPFISTLVPHEYVSAVQIAVAAATGLALLMQTDRITGWFYPEPMPEKPDTDAEFEEDDADEE